MRTEVIVVVAPRFDGLARLGETEEHVLIEAYMDPASAQGYFSMLRIGCSHISGLFVGVTISTPGPDGNPRTFTSSLVWPRGPRLDSGLESAGLTGSPSSLKPPAQSRGMVTMPFLAPPRPFSQLGGCGRENGAGR